MKNSFDTFDYVKDLGEDLIREFEKAGKTTHSHSVGGGREKSAIDKLRDILPEGVGVGQGFVIDSFGNVSGQCDIILYEKDLCLKFNSNDSPNCYYNCESVIAVGEVKSDLYKKDLVDSINKMKKIRNLIRRCYNKYKVRSYLSSNDLIVSEEEKYEQFTKNNDQIFTFLICNSFKSKESTIISTLKSTNDNLYEYINCIISINGKYIGYCKKVEIENSVAYEKTLGALDSDAFVISDTGNSFGQLLYLIFLIIYIGRTVDYNPRIYILPSKSIDVSFYPLK